MFTVSYKLEYCFQIIIFLLIFKYVSKNYEFLVLSYMYFIHLIFVCYNDIIDYWLIIKCVAALQMFLFYYTNESFFTTSGHLNLNYIKQYFNTQPIT